MQDAVRDFAVALALPEKVLRHFILAMEEIVANAMLHGRSDTAADTINIEVHLDDAAIRCEIVDAGIPFDPFTEAPEPDLASAIPERQVGGLGIHIVKKVIDSYSYERRGDCNHTILIKKVV